MSTLQVVTSFNELFGRYEDHSEPIVNEETVLELFDDEETPLYGAVNPQSVELHTLRGSFNFKPAKECEHLAHIDEQRVQDSWAWIGQTLHERGSYQDPGHAMRAARKSTYNVWCKFGLELTTRPEDVPTILMDILTAAPSINSATTLAKHFKRQHDQELTRRDRALPVVHRETLERRIRIDFGYIHNAVLTETDPVIAWQEFNEVKLDLFVGLLRSNHYGLHAANQNLRGDLTLVGLRTSLCRRVACSTGGVRRFLRDFLWLNRDSRQVYRLPAIATTNPAPRKTHRVIESGAAFRARDPLDVGNRGESLIHLDFLPSSAICY